LRAGSTYTAEVVTLQTDLGIKADGKFGPMTTAAVKAFQTKNSLVADGVFGAKSLAALGGSTTTTTTTTTTTSSTQAGCVAGGAFSSTTGLSCTTAMAPVSGCAAGALFSATTGASCGTATSTTVVLNSSGEGTLTLQSAPVTLTDSVGQGDSKDAVMAFQLKATGSQIKVDRVNIDLHSGTYTSGNNGTTGTSALPWNYFTNLYLYQDGNLIGTLPVSSNTLTQNTFGIDYTASFQGLSANVLVGTPSNFTVEADIAGTLPAAMTSTPYIVGLNDASTSQVIRGTDGAGLSEYVTASTNNQQIVTFAQNGSGNITVTTDSSNPIGNNIVENSNQTSTGNTALVFDLKNTTNSTATIESINATLGSINSSVSAYYL
jgi:peptidoglycan hydrolase-like protein with peptidoglycan-binding domain